MNVNFLKCENDNISSERRSLFLCVAHWSSIFCTTFGWLLKNKEVRYIDKANVMSTKVFCAILKVFWHFFILYFFFIEVSWFTMLCSFLVYSRVIQLYIFMHSFLYYFPLRFITGFFFFFCKSMFILSVFIVAKKWKQPKCP